MLEKVKFKHLRGFMEDKVNYASIMSEVLGYKNYWLGRRWVFVWKFKQAHKLVTAMKKVNPEKVVLNNDCEIKFPKKVDFISYKAMMEVHALLNSELDLGIVDLMTELITKVCYSENVKGVYESNGDKYNDFKNRVLNAPFLDMIGLYNFIDKGLEESSKHWNERFMSVEVVDEDYEMAGGSRMAQFNVINSIKSICKDFNITYNDAWQVSYGLVQTNSYEKASANYTQEQMRILKETRMKRERS